MSEVHITKKNFILNFLYFLFVVGELTSSKKIYRKMWQRKLSLIAILIPFLATATKCSIVNDYVHHAKHQHSRHKVTTHKFTIEDLLSKTFPYNDPRHDNQYDMDPCKAGNVNTIFLLLQAMLFEIVKIYCRVDM